MSFLREFQNMSSTVMLSLVLVSLETFVSVIFAIEPSIILQFQNLIPAHMCATFQKNQLLIKHLYKIYVYSKANAAVAF